MQAHPFAPRMFFTETLTGDPEIEAIHREVRAQASAALGAIVGREADFGDPPARRWPPR